MKTNFIELTNCSVLNTEKGKWNDTTERKVLINVNHILCIDEDAKVIVTKDYNFYFKETYEEVKGLIGI